MPKTTAAATARPKRARKPAASGRRRAISHEQIAARAYELHLARAEGDPVEHWLRAERELSGA